MNTKTTICGLLAIALTQSVSAQVEGCEPSSDWIQSGIEKHDEGEFAAAVEEYQKVHPNDSLYSLARYEEGLSLLSLEKYEESIEAFQEVLNLDGGDEVQSLINIGSAFDYLENRDSALHYYDLAAERFPYNYSVYFNRGVTYEGMGEHAKALEDYKTAVTLNPYHPTSHIRLGSLAANEGEITKALLSWTTFLLLEPATNRSFEVLGMVDQMVGVGWNGSSVGLKISQPGTDDFAEMDLLLNNRVALNKKYKYPFKKLGLDLSKQTYMVIQEIAFNEDDPGFWMQTYVPLFVAVRNAGKVEGLVYTEAVTVGAYEKEVSKKLNLIKDFIAWFKTEWAEVNSQKPFPVDGKMKVMDIAYANSGQANVCGTVKNDHFEGDVIYIQQNGRIASRGMFNSNGNREGEWKYYHPNGELSEHLTFRDGKWGGPYFLYASNGMITQEGSMSQSKRNGDVKNYSEFGVLYSIVPYKNGEPEGVITFFHDNGQISETRTYSNGSPNGSFKRYHPNGQLAQEGILTEGLLEGESKWYYSNGQLMKTGVFKNDLPEGEMLEYYMNGALQERTTYKDGNAVGESVKYHANGNVANQTTYSTDGKLTGVLTLFDYDGKRIETNDFKKKEVMAYTQYHRDGQVIAEGKKKGGVMRYQDYLGDGTLVTEGDYEPSGGNKRGPWKYYHTSGTIRREANFVNGVEDGDYTEYYRDGSVFYATKLIEGKQEAAIARKTILGDLEFTGQYLGGERCGEWRGYYNDGETLSYISYYIDGELSGKYESFDSQGIKDRELFYLDGVMIKELHFDQEGKAYFTMVLDTGTVKVQRPFANGAKQADLIYRNFKLDGPATWYYPNGKISTQGAYSNGERQGDWIWYFDNGKTSTKRSYQLGEEHGLYQRYFENGKLRTEQNFVNGNKEGLEKQYFENGKLDREINYVNDERHGETRYYAEDGSLQMARKYYHGKLEAVGYLKSDGKTIEWTTLENESGEVKTYYPSGQLARSFTLENGLLVGSYLKYHPNGQLQEELTFEKGQLNGMNKLYYPSGQVKEENPYVHGDLHGEEILYHSNGKVSRKRQWVNGDVHGLDLRFDRNGKKLSSHTYREGVLVDM